jgi:histidinol-phosphate aminotransferase
VEQRNANPINYPLDQKETEFITNIDTILEYKKQYSPKLILVCAPNNPTGNYVDLNELERLLKNHKDGIVCLDETYWGFTKEDTTPKIIELLQKYSNLIVIRSFSKYYALAGVRIGYAFCGAKVKDTMRFYNKILGFNRISENLAVAAFNSNGYYSKIIKSIIKDRETLYNGLNKIDAITAYKSSANFILVKMPNKIKKPLDNELKKEGIVIKFFTEPSFTDCARISLGTEVHNQIVLDTVNKLVLNKTLA